MDNTLYKKALVDNIMLTMARELSQAATNQWMPWDEKMKLVQRIYKQLPELNRAMITLQTEEIRIK